MLTRNLHKARKAFKKRSVYDSVKAHKFMPKTSEEHKLEKGQYIKSLIYGGLDGIITTFAVVAGVSGASLSAGIVLILGFANLFADGLSMGIGDFLSTKAEIEYQQAERERELWEVEHYAEGERVEMIELYMEKGISKEDSEAMVGIISKYKDAWVDIMMVEELGIVVDKKSPLKNALVTFFSFAIFGFIPLLAYVLSSFIPVVQENTFLIAGILTGLTLFLLGTLKVLITAKNWFVSGFEMLIVGGIAAFAAYGIGVLLAGLA